MKHELYKTADKDAPEQIKDRNGEVVLRMCRVCGDYEASLSGDCPGETPSSADSMSIQSACLILDSLSPNFGR